jgi:hypothetical protein
MVISTSCNALPALANGPDQRMESDKYRFVILDAHRFCSEYFQDRVLGNRYYIGSGQEPLNNAPKGSNHYRCKSQYVIKTSGKGSVGGGIGAKKFGIGGEIGGGYESSWEESDIKTEYREIPYNTACKQQQGVSVYVWGQAKQNRGFVYCRHNK